MKRDAWYAAIAALGLCAAGAAYALVAAPKLADPKVRLPKSNLTASLPSPPEYGPSRDAIEKAKAILAQRDPFTPATDGQVSAGRALSLPKLGPPVRFSVPGDARRVTTASSSPAPAQTRRTVSRPVQPQPVNPIVRAQPPQPTQPARQPVPEQPRGELTLRGVFPSPTGGRALVAMPNGSMVSVGVGGEVGGWRVLQIQQGAIRLGRGQRAILLAMPR